MKWLLASLLILCSAVLALPPTAVAPARSPQQQAASYTNSSGNISDWSDIPNLFLVLDANLGATNSAGSLAVGGDKLKSWRDSSGNGHHVFTNGAACTFSSSAFGTNAGINFGSMWAAFTALPDTTILIAVKLTTSGTYLAGFDSTNTTARQIVFKDNAGLPNFYSGTTRTGGNALALGYYTFMATFNSGGNDFLYTNGVQCVTGDTGNQSLDGIKVGAQYDDTIPWGQYIGLVVIWNRVLNATERGQVEALAVARGWR